MQLNEDGRYDPKNIIPNPLADYKGQTEEKKRPRSLPLGETSLGIDVRNDASAYTEDTPVYWSDDTSNYPFVKLMVSLDNKLALLSLTETALKLFIVILFQLRHKMDVVDLDPARLKRLGFDPSPGARVNAIEQLESKGIIKRIGKKQKDEDYWHFFINPQMMWIGDNKEYYKQILKHHKEYKDLGAASKQKQSRKRSPKSEEGKNA